ncbi:MAG: hypothetical protein WCI92_03445 [Bacteroidota bacterium]
MPGLKTIFRFLLLIIIPISIAGCLTCERKEYVFQLTGENSGKLTIKYINIFSSLIDSTGELSADYDELINLWLKGEKLERDFPEATKFRKRIFEEDGTLCGEVTMEFDDLSKVHLYRFKNSGPFMFSLSSFNDDGETFLQTNGELGGEKMPVIFWPAEEQSLRFSTKIATPDSSCVSMLKQWEEKQSSFQPMKIKQFLTLPGWQNLKDKFLK